MLTYTEIRKAAREALRNNWWNAVAAYLIYFAITVIVGSIPGAGQIAIILAAGALTYGLSLFFLSLVRKRATDLNEIFKGFNFSGTNMGLFGKTMGVFLLSSLYIFLWSLLFIIPGIVAAYSYRLIYYLLIDRPELSVSEILRESRSMMYGNKARLFWLDLSFIGWFILCCFTFGIGFLFLSPYMCTAAVIFYENLRKEN
ncbi:MAG: DUF975 family protein [Candidatus Cloacimonetes bacterium]|nr:DUF975 family protein [Candidatus Cloacimonadota bacterium]